MLLHWHTENFRNVRKTDKITNNWDKGTHKKKWWTSNFFWWNYAWFKIEHISVRTKVLLKRIIVFYLDRERFFRVFPSDARWCQKQRPKTKKHKKKNTMFVHSFCTYLRKNNEPSGKITLRSSGTNGTPLWNQTISGGGRPVALQFSVNGSSLAATASVGCSVMRGRCWAAKKGKKIKNYLLRFVIETRRNLTHLYRRMISYNVM